MRLLRFWECGCGPDRARGVGGTPSPALRERWVDTRLKKEERGSLPPLRFLAGKKEQELVGNIDYEYSLYENENIPGYKREHCPVG